MMVILMSVRHGRMDGKEYFEVGCVSETYREIRGLDECCGFDDRSIFVPCCGGVRAVGSNTQ
jgi:hypothetical protein